MDTVYIETSVISYLRQKPAKEVITAAHQLLTHQWWDTERKNYALVVSQYVIDEASAGCGPVERVGWHPSATGRSRN